MIFINKITLHNLSKDGKNHKWPSCTCEKCQRKMWGHGLVGRYLCTWGQIYVKRYRCPGCGAVVTARPQGFWPFIRSSIHVVYQALCTRLSCGRWPLATTRQRGGHWLKALGIFARMSCQNNLLSFLDHCWEKDLYFFT
jgi:hypothetical protein